MTAGKLSAWSLNRVEDQPRVDEMASHTADPDFDAVTDAGYRGADLTGCEPLDHPVREKRSSHDQDPIAPTHVASGLRQAAMQRTNPPRSRG